MGAGFAADEDGWAEPSGPRWSWEALRPLFLEVARTTGTSDADYGSDGAVSIEAQRDPRPDTAAFLQAGEAGYPVEAAKGLTPRGLSQTMVGQLRGPGPAPLTHTSSRRAAAATSP